MKVKLSIHTLIVQASKIPFCWDEDTPLKDQIIFFSLQSILEGLPNICAADYSGAVRYYSGRSIIIRELFGYDFDIYKKCCMQKLPFDIAAALLKSMLEVVPDGEILLELDEEEYLTLRSLTDSYNYDTLFPPEYRDDRYSTLEVEE